MQEKALMFHTDAVQAGISTLTKERKDMLSLSHIYFTPKASACFTQEREYFKKVL